MSRNVLLINGSPKGKQSNTYKLATAFIEGLKIAENELVVEEICVNNLDLNPCLGCFSCWNKTPGECVFKDDMLEVIEKLLWADITIWSFPLYYFSVPGKLKTLIDRQLPMVLPFMEKNAKSGSHPTRYDMSKKRSVIISTCGFYTTEGNYDAVISMFNHLLGKDNYEKIFCSQGELFRVPELSNRTNEYLEYVKVAGQEFISGKIEVSTKNKLNTLLFPKETFEAMADASWGVEKETGEKLDESLIFTKQMAALYNKKSYSGKDIVLEMNYTDINKCYQIVLKKDGTEVLTENFKPFTTKIDTPFTVWSDIASGKIRGEEALMKQMYKVNGDFNLMIHWDHYFGAENEAVETNNKKQDVSKTNMVILLLPWIVFWVATSINGFKGSLISIISCAIVSLLFHKNKKTIYDNISNAAVILFSVLCFMKIDVNIILPISYLGFGLMWSISCLTRIPLTAHYSANDYNGESAFLNPLFIKTNLILTLMWGILYVLTSVMTFFVMKTSFSSYLGIINNILPIFMGIFTAWFQKWYPAKVARGK
jgi:multimeric flavodoxin WrbA